MTPLELAMQASVDEVLSTKRPAPTAPAEPAGAPAAPAAPARSHLDATRQPHRDAKRDASVDAAEQERLAFEAELDAEAAAATMALGSIRAGSASVDHRAAAETDDSDDEFEFDGGAAVSTGTPIQAAPATEPSSPPKSVASVSPAAPADARAADPYSAELRRRSEAARALAAAEQRDAALSELRGSSASALRFVMAQSTAAAEPAVAHEAKSAAERADEQAAARLRGGLIRLTEEGEGEEEERAEGVVEEDDEPAGARALTMSVVAGTGARPPASALASDAAAAAAKRARDDAERAALAAQWDAVEQASAAEAERARARAALPAGGRLGAKGKGDKIGFVEAYARLADEADARADCVEITREDWTEAGCLPRTLPFLRARLRGERLAAERDRLLRIAKLAFADGDATHDRVLNSIYKALTGSERDPPAEGGHWEELGFQGRRPSTDLRDLGMFSLLNALHLVSRRRRLAARLLALSRAQPGEFPFMAVSINLTKVCVDALRCGALTRAANDAGSLVEVFHELHAGLFAHMGEQWHARKLTIMDFNAMLKELRTLGTRKTAAMLQKARDLEKGPKVDFSDKARFDG